jgi:hypothetical protein
LCACEACATLSTAVHVQRYPRHARCGVCVKLICLIPALVAYPIRIPWGDKARRHRGVHTLLMIGWEEEGGGGGGGKGGTEGKEGKGGKEGKEARTVIGGAKTVNVLRMADVHSECAAYAECTQ